MAALKSPQRPEHFARVTGSPGEAPRVAGLLRILWPFILIVFAAGYLTRAAIPTPTWTASWIGAGYLFLAGLLAWLVTAGRERLDNFLKGARGEESVARTLSFLPATFHVYHGLSMQRSSLRSSNADYDHVVIGPTGIFMIETKNWSGRIQVENGEILYDQERPDRPPLEQVKGAAAMLRKELQENVHRNLDVQPVLCFASGRLATGQVGAAGVVICTGHTLIDALHEKPESPLPKEFVDQIAIYLDQRMGLS